MATAMLASPKRSALLSGCLHAAAIVLVLLATNPHLPPVVTMQTNDTTIHYVPLVPLPGKSRGGGGGGARDRTPARKGPLPRPSRTPFVPPTVHLIQFQPRLAMEPAILDSPEVAMPVQTFGLPDGILNGGGGRGKGPGIGEGEGPGAGPGKGPGAGPSEGQGGISGLTPRRGSIVNPTLVSQSEPEYSDEARRAKLQGTVLLRIEVSERGQVQNVVVRQSLGLGLDEKAIEAVRRWKFRPGLVDGKPTAMPALIEVSFRLL